MKASFFLLINALLKMVCKYKTLKTEHKYITNYEFCRLTVHISNKCICIILISLSKKVMWPRKAVLFLIFNTGRQFERFWTVSGTAMRITTHQNYHNSSYFKQSIISVHPKKKNRREGMQDRVQCTSELAMKIVSSFQMKQCKIAK